MADLFTKRQLALLDSRIAQAQSSVIYKQPTAKKPVAVLRAEATIKAWEADRDKVIRQTTVEKSKKHQEVKNVLEFGDTKAEILKAVEGYEAWAADYLKRCV